MSARRRIGELAGELSGATVVEFALIMPVFALAIFGITQLAGLAFAQASLNFAIQEAARCASVRTDLCGTPQAIQSYAADHSFGVLSAGAVSVSAQACGTHISAQASFNLARLDSLPAPMLSGEICTP